MNRNLICISLLSLSPILLGSHAFSQVIEPENYRGNPYRAEVPATLLGATVVSDEEAYELWQEGAHFIDVLPHTLKPENLPEGTVWNEKPRHSIEGAIWLPNVGYEELAEETQAYFQAGLAHITVENKNAKIVLFCRAECWMSWNAAKRAIEIGYTDVHWYPSGTDGWMFMGYPYEVLQPSPPKFQDSPQQVGRKN